MFRLKELWIIIKLILLLTLKLIYNLLIKLLVSSMGKVNDRIENRRTAILAKLPLDENKGKTYDEIASETEYSTATIRGDLQALQAKGLVGCDTRRPFKWYRIAERDR